MVKTHTPIIPGFDKLLHGGDYNPDQWQHRPDIIEADYRLQKLAGCNAFSIGIFAWTSYESIEGVYNFDWLDRTMDGLHAEGSKVFLATPSGAKPAWMSLKYPEIRRVNAQGLREPHKGRHNHCPTSPVYREKIAALNEQLAKRYAQHPALGGWHISNEYSGCCYCETCLDSFYQWLKQRYGDLDTLNRAWWTEFWSHRFTDWKEIDPRDENIDGLALDWKRYTTWITCDFMSHEIAAVRKHSDLPATTNMMGYFGGLDYYRVAELCDFIADDNYPSWNLPDKTQLIAGVAMTHDLHRSMQQKPFLLIESTPSITNWQNIVHQKRPGLHRLQMLQAIAHGADGVMYFQWRKGQGGCEKFHGAVVDHEGSEHSLTFREVAVVGKLLEKIGEVRGAHTPAQTALIYDWESLWGLEVSAGPIHTSKKNYTEVCQQFHQCLWSNSVSVDIIESTTDFSSYRLILAPQLFMLKPGVAGQMRNFVENGGVLVLTTLSGIVNQNNACFLGGQPGDGLRELCGIWVEEIDEFDANDLVEMTYEPENSLDLCGSVALNTCIDCIHDEGAEVLARLKNGIYAGHPALTVNRVGEGAVYYLGGRCDTNSLNRLINSIQARADIQSPFKGLLPEGVVAQLRANGNGRFFFLLNTTDQSQTITLPEGRFEVLTGENLDGVNLPLPKYGSVVVREY